MVPPCFPDPWNGEPHAGDVVWGIGISFRGSRKLVFLGALSVLSVLWLSYDMNINFG